MAKRMRRGGSDPPRKSAGRGRQGATPNDHGHARFAKFTAAQSCPAPNDAAKSTHDGDGLPVCTCPAGPRCLPTCPKWRWFETVRTTANTIIANPAHFLGGWAGVAAAALAAVRVS